MIEQLDKLDQITISLADGLQITRAGRCYGQKLVNVKKEFEALKGHSNDGTGKYTHLVVSRDEFKTKPNLIQPAIEANPGIQVVDSAWLEELLTAKKRVDVGAHLLYPHITIAFASPYKGNGEVALSATLPQTKANIRRLGGKCQHVISNITHLIVGYDEPETEASLNRIEKAKNCSPEVRIVSYDWLKASYEASRWVDARDYLLPSKTQYSLDQQDEGSIPKPAATTDEETHPLEKKGEEAASSNAASDPDSTSSSSGTTDSDSGTTDSSSESSGLSSVTSTGTRTKLPRPGGLWNSTIPIILPNAGGKVTAKNNEESRYLITCAESDWKEETEGSLCRYATSRTDHWDKVKLLTSSDAKTKLRRVQKNLSLRRDIGTKPRDQLQALGNNRPHAKYFLLIFIAIKDMKIDGMDPDCTKACLVLLSVMNQEYFTIFRGEDYINKGIITLEHLTNAKDQRRPQIKVGPAPPAEAALPAKTPRPRRSQAKAEPPAEAARPAKTPRRPQPPAKVRRNLRSQKRTTGS